MASLKNVSKLFVNKNQIFSIFSRTFAVQAQIDDVICENLRGDHEGITVFGLNRPKQKNAFSMNLVKQLTKALDEMSHSDARVLIIRSMVPGIFCAGN